MPQRILSSMRRLCFRDMAVCDLFAGDMGSGLRVAQKTHEELRLRPRPSVSSSCGIIGRSALTLTKRRVTMLKCIKLGVLIVATSILASGAFAQQSSADNQSTVLQNNPAL